MDDERADKLQNEATVFGEGIVADFKAGTIHDTGAAKLILNALADILASPSLDGGGVRESDLALLKRQYGDLSKWADGNQNGQ
jgi:hypothetical protein